jgi:hypothetical protein
VKENIVGKSNWELPVALPELLPSLNQIKQLKSNSKKHNNGSVQFLFQKQM